MHFYKLWLPALVFQLIGNGFKVFGVSQKIRYTPYGCYIYSGTEEDVIAGSQSVSYTLKLCVIFCFNEGQQYGGQLNKKECRCSNTFEELVQYPRYLRSRYCSWTKYRNRIQIFSVAIPDRIPTKFPTPPQVITPKKDLHKTPPTHSPPERVRPVSPLVINASSTISNSVTILPVTSKFSTSSSFITQNSSAPPETGRLVQGWNMGLSIGLGVSMPIALLIGIIAVFIYRRRRNSRSSTMASDQTETHYAEPSTPLDNNSTKEKADKISTNQEAVASSDRPDTQESVGDSVYVNSTDNCNEYYNMEEINQDMDSVTENIYSLAEPIANDLVVEENELYGT